jgi:MoxR-like ATPase
MLHIRIGYPDLAEEVGILRSTTGPEDIAVTPVLGADDVIALQHLVREVPVAPQLYEYAAKLARATRPGGEAAPDDVARWVRWGAGPRAGQALILGAKARALLDGRVSITADDLAGMAGPVLRHRILLNFQAEAEGVRTDTLIARVLEAVPPPRSGL